MNFKCCQIQTPNSSTLECPHLYLETHKFSDKRVFAPNSLTGKNVYIHAVGDEL